MLLTCPAHGYTLKEACPACGRATVKPGPAKYSPEDAYGVYRRKLKKLDRAERAQAPKGASA